MILSAIPLAALGTAFWLGLLTAISPCPMATNVAAIGYLARFSGTRRRQFVSGILYSLGRAMAYMLVGALIIRGLLSAPTVSTFLQRHLSQLLGPILILTGMVLLGMFPELPSFGGMGAATGEKLARMGQAGSLTLGFVFALAFCPVSAALFFGSLLPVAVQNQSVWWMPALFGLGSAVPVLGFAVAMGLGREAAGKLFGKISAADRWLLPATAWLLIAVGLWMVARILLA